MSLAYRQLLTYWSQLEMDYKIPRRTKIDSLDAEDNAQTHTLTEAPAFTYEHRRPHAWENTQTIEIKVAPVIYRAPSAFFRPAPPPPLPSPKPQIAQSAMNRSKLDAIIASAQQNLPAASSTPGSQSPADSLRSRSSMDDGSRKRVKFSQALESNGSTVEPSDYERNIAEEEAMKKEKRLMKLVGEHVVRSMNKYKEMMDHETFKKYAKEVSLKTALGEQLGRPGSESGELIFDSAPKYLWTKRNDHIPTRRLGTLLSRTRRRQRSKLSPRSSRTKC